MLDRAYWTLKNDMNEKPTCKQKVLITAPKNVNHKSEGIEEGEKQLDAQYERQA